MKRIVLSFVSTLTAVVLLFSYKTSLSPSAASSQAAVISPRTTSVTVGTTTSSGSPDDSSSTASGSTGSSSSTAKTKVTGSVVQTRWGPVQVQLSVSGGNIVSVQVLQAPSENGRDVEINNYALPILMKETVQAQSAQIDMVSGATYTSDGYLQSLQSALDSANL